MSRTVVVSDVHFGSLHLKQSQVDKLVALIQSAAPGDRLIFNGDIYDLWLYPNDPQAALLPARPIMQILRGYISTRRNPVYYVVGNHDSEMWKLNPHPWLPMSDAVTFEDGGKKFIVKHGHQYDPANKNGPWYSRLLVATQGLFDVLGLNPQKAAHRWSFAENADKKMEAEQRDRIQAAMTGKCDVIITGHTHRSGIEQRGPLLMVNDGDIIEHSEYCVIENGHVELRHL